MPGSVLVHSCNCQPLPENAGEQTLTHCHSPVSKASESPIELSKSIRVTLNTELARHSV
jgi:hypothetical protein